MYIVVEISTKYKLVKQIYVK